MGVFLFSMAFIASELTASMVSPGGAERAFWEPIQHISILLSSTLRGTPKVEETQSATVSMPYSLSMGQMAATSFKIPLGVSQWTMVAYLKSWSDSRKSLSARGSMGLW